MVTKQLNFTDNHGAVYQKSMVLLADGTYADAVIIAEDVDAKDNWEAGEYELNADDQLTYEVRVNSLNGIKQRRNWVSTVDSITKAVKSTPGEWYVL